MKFKFLILGGIFALSSNAMAQTEKGKHLVGGSIGFATYTGEQRPMTSKQNSFSIGPKYGYFIGNNFAIGLDANFGRDRATSSYVQTMAINGSYSEQTVNQTTKSNKVSVGTFARYYVNISERFKFFGQLNASIGSGKDENSNNSPAVWKTTFYDASLSPAIAFFPTKKLGLELGFGLISYFNSKIKYDGTPNGIDAKSEGFNVGLRTLDPKIGVNFHL